MAEERPGTDEPEARYTFLVVPEGGRGRVIERTWSAQTVRNVVGLAAGAVGLLILGAVIQAGTFHRVVAYDRLVSENRRLRVEQGEIAEQLAELDPLIQRVRAYDEQLRDLAAKGALPGVGPLDEAAMAEREDWLRGVVGHGQPDDEVLDPDALFAELQAIDLAALEDNLGRIQLAQEAMPQLWPVEGPVSSGFGWRRDPFGRRWKFHGGVDIGGDYGAAILATGAGVVTFADWHSGNGRMVEVDHGEGIVTRYSHASQLLVSKGDEVLAGETLALVGSSGRSTGAHLHYELFLDGERVDPLPYLPEPTY